MQIGKINAPIYGICILLSLIATTIYLVINLNKNKENKEHILYFVLLVFVYSFFGSLILSKITKDDGLSSYAGAVSVIIAAFIYSKIIKDKKGLYLKYSIISLPFTYSIAKIGCFFAGCCYGIPYNGILSVTYTNGLNIPLVPVQLIETILFFILFLILNKYKNNKYIIEIVFITCGLLKFILDFLRYNHTYEIISKNQIISIFFIIIGIISIINKNFKK